MIAVNRHTGPGASMACVSTAPAARGDAVASGAGWCGGSAASEHGLTRPRVAEYAGAHGETPKGVDELVVARPWAEHAADCCGRGPLLLVEDSAEDYESLVRGLQRLGMHDPVYCFSHGEAAMQYLNHRGLFFKPGASPRPEAIILDLGLPGLSGLNVLRAIRSDPMLATIPVVILSGSATLSEAHACLAAGANGFVHKHADAQRVAELVHAALQHCLVGSLSLSAG